jgi:TFIIF-interacting CTD phosphatase-like protein
MFRLNSIRRVGGTIFGLTFVGVGSAGTMGYCCMDDSKKINLVLDLDETLFFTKKTNLLNQNLAKFNSPDVVIIDTDTDDTSPNKDYAVWKRPHSDLMFRALGPFCNFYVYTSATQSYADPIIKSLGWGNHFKNCRYRDEDYHLCKCKDVTKVVNEEDREKRTILVDDRNFNYCVGKRSSNDNREVAEFNHIPPYTFHVKNDRELLKLVGSIIWKYYF